MPIGSFVLLLPTSRQTLCDEVGLSVTVSFCLSVAAQDYSRSNQSISWKLNVVIGPTNRIGRID